MPAPIDSKIGVSDNTGGAQVETIKFDPGTGNVHRQVIAVGAFTSRIDDTSTPGKTYVGKALAGSSEIESVWQIQRIDESGSTTIILFASGSDDYNVKWSDRTSLSYS
jgi:hypothetical protein